jgi:type IV pilus assembly protein PilW
MVAMVITLVILAAATSVTLQVRNLYLLDQARTTVNQDLRGGMEVVAADIRQAGERLPSNPLIPHNIPPLQIIDGASGASDQLILTRNVLDAVLPVCTDIAAGSTTSTVQIADTSSNPPAGCAPVPDNNGDGWPDNLGSWYNYRLAEGGSVRAYIFDPVTGDGEFFDYVSESASLYQIQRASGSWLYNYPVTDKPQVYMLDQRDYSRNGNLMHLLINAQDNYDVTADITDLQAEAIMQDGSVLTSFGAGDSWLNVKAIQITLNGQQATATNKIYSNSLSMQLFPRNILSK